MKVESTLQQIIGIQKETKVNAAGNFSNKSRTNGTAPSAQSVNNVDSVILSEKSLALSRAENAFKTSNGSATQKGENNAPQHKTEEKTENEKAVILGEKSLTPSRAEDAFKTSNGSATQKGENNAPQHKTEEKTENEKAVVEKKKIKSEILVIDKSLKSKKKEIEKIDKDLKKQNVNAAIFGEKSLAPSRVENVFKTSNGIATQKGENNVPQRKPEVETENKKADIEKKKIKSEILAIDKSLKLKEQEVEKIDRDLMKQSVNVLI